MLFFRPFYAVPVESVADAGVQNLADVPQVRDLLRGGQTFLGGLVAKSTSFLFRRQTCKKRGACERPIFAIFLLVKRPFPCYTTVIRLFPRKLSILRGRKG